METKTTILDWIRFSLSKMQQHNLAVGQTATNLFEEALNLVALTLHLTPQQAIELQNAQVSKEERARLEENLNTRIQAKKPVSYITKNAWFAGKPYFVDERVLIPRSPIEELIDDAFGVFFDEYSTPQRVLDMCTGSGCLGIATSHAFPLAQVDLVDISDAALNVAKINIKNHQVENRVTAIKSDVWQNLDATKKYDLIISNPPYVDTQLWESQASEYKHEPKLALEAGADGLDIARKILADVKNYLTERGILILEVGTSWQFLEQAFPEVPFMWIEFESGAEGVLVITHKELEEYKEIFNF